MAAPTGPPPEPAAAPIAKPERAPAPAPAAAPPIVIPKASRTVLPSIPLYPSILEIVSFNSRLSSYIVEAYLLKTWAFSA